MGFSLRSIKNTGPLQTGSESLDIYSPSAFDKRWPGCREYLGVTADAVENGVAGAKRFLLSTLFTDEKIRKKYPRALTEGSKGAFAHFLSSNLSSQGKQNLELAIDDPSWVRIFDYYLREPHFHFELPSGLVPGAQKRFLRWLFDYGREKEGFQESDILGFLQLCSENPVQMLTTSYLLQPEWQKQFPDALQSGKEQPFLEWVDEVFKPAKISPLPKSAFPPDFSLRSRTLEHSVSPEDRTPFIWSAIKRKWWNGFRQSNTTERGVNILGPFCFSGGTGEAARTTAQALQSAGLPVSCRDIPGAPTETPRSDYLGTECYPFTLIHSVPDDPLSVLFRHVGWPVESEKRRIGIWYWELETLPTHWAGNEEGLHEIWAPTEFIAETMRRHFSIPVFKMLPAVRHIPTQQMSRRELGLPDDRFLFLFMFDMASTFERKNPLAIIEAFLLAGAKDATLVIKVSRGSFDPAAMEKLRTEGARCGALILEGVWSREKTQALIAQCDCYISLHRSEGFGLPLAEAMIMGKPVIASRYSGNLDFMNDTNSLLVDCGQISVGPNVPIYPANSRWADPSVTQAAEFIRNVADNHAAGRTLGEKARRDCIELLSPEAYGKRMLRRLSELGLGTQGLSRK